MDDHNGKQILINGTSMTSLCSETKIMAHLPILLNPHTKNILVICYGMGTCLRSAVTHKEVNCDVAELVGEEFKVGSYFHANAVEVLNNKRVHHYADDGRNFLLLHDKKYDVITIDPAPPIWSAGTVNLYTLEFFKLCKQRLNDSGILCLWIPPAPYSEAKMIMKSFYDVFPNSYVYRGPHYKGLYMTGYVTYYPPNIARFDSAASNPAIMADLNEWDPIAPKSPSQLLQLEVLNPTTLAEFVNGTKEVSDVHPYTEFPLWRRVFSPADFRKILDASEFTVIDTVKAPHINPNSN
jgi:spermidine synthase